MTDNRTFKDHNVKHLLVNEIENIIWKQFMSLVFAMDNKRNLQVAVYAHNSHYMFVNFPYLFTKGF